ncbi:hypothetical protein [Candidatus Chlorohelix sp.]|uniref:hypothetical protein n=1 Tax=Candidatus Chlorohelix sp. TaxID=3139201 RepID=UPI003054BD9B
MLPRLQRLTVFHLFPLVLFLLGSLIFTWPTVLHLGQNIISNGSGDVWQHLWNQWWTTFSLFERHSHPYYTPSLFYPDGANLFFHALNPLTAFLAIPLKALFGLSASFVMVQFLQVTVAAYGTYLLTFYMTGYFGGALVAGIIYGFCPLQAELLNLGQLELTSIEWLPLFTLFFIKTMRGDSRPWLNRILSAFFLIALSLTTWYYTLYALLFSGLYLLWEGFISLKEWKIKWHILAGRYFSVIILWLIPVSPLLFFTLRDAAGGSTQASQSIFNVIYNSADLAGFFRPGTSAIWGLFGSQAGDDIRGQFLGYTVLGLTGFGLVVKWKEARFWFFIAFVFFLLALGPVSHFTFDPNWSAANGEAEKGLPLLGRLLYTIPLGNILRVPLRFTLMVMLSLSICAAYALAWLNTRYKQKGLQNWKLVVLPTIAGLLVFFEFLPIPRVLVNTDISPFYQQIRDEGKWNDFAIVELPQAVSARAMYFQTLSQHPITTGYISRKPTNYRFFENIGVNREIIDLEDMPLLDIFNWSRIENVASVLSANGIRYVVLHPNYYSPENWKTASERMQEIFGSGKPYYQDSELVAYRVEPLDNATPNASKIFPKLGDGWGGRILLDNKASRAIGKQAVLTLTSPYRQSFKATLNVQVSSLDKPHIMSVILNNKQIFSQTIPLTATSIDLPMDLLYGQNLLNFEVDGEGMNLIFESFSLY